MTLYKKCYSATCDGKTDNWSKTEFSGIVRCNHCSSLTKKEVVR